MASCDYKKTLEMLLEGVERKEDDGRGDEEEGKKKAEEAKAEQNSERRNSIDSMGFYFKSWKPSL
jgi:hypothetical protein